MPYIARRIAELPPGSVILLRKPRIGKTAFLESVVAHIAEGNSLLVDWFWPEEGGREQTYNRDFELVAAADIVECYFSIDAIMEGGTAHVVEAAMDRSIPVYAYSVDSHGNISRIGEMEAEVSSSQTG